MVAVLLAQFLSALGDNALLVAAIALVKAQGEAGLIPLLQEFFVIPYIFLAPFVGPLADTLPKGRVMFLSNACKLAGAGLMFAGANPLAAYGLVGMGAAAYSPAKYGILSQLFGPQKLVKANGMLEASTIVAILLGVVAGGLLADTSLNAAFLGVIGAYTLAAVFNLLIPRLPPEHPLGHFNPLILLGDFAVALKTMLRCADTRFSLIGTSVFWGTGTTLRLMLFAWVPAVLLIADNQMPANLMGVVSVGIVFGAVAAGMLISLEKVNRALLGGILLGPLVLLIAQANSLPLAAVLLVSVGMAGGAFVVPLNALLQERGHHSVGAGRALAVQNLFENGAMLIFVGAYSLCVHWGISVTATMTGFGLVVLVGIAGLAIMRVRGEPSPDAAQRNPGGLRNDHETTSRFCQKS
ncbi:MAG: lysophospholipid transporter LplT [Sulfuricella sp.]|nr:lysophospholipid transporter LplT [Sulfuricella sp.]